jgi:hypothetical protein
MRGRPPWKEIAAFLTTTTVRLRCRPPSRKRSHRCLFCRDSATRAS